MPEDQNVTVKETSSPHILIRALWFILLGWELTAIWLLAAWILNITVIGLPLGIKMINLVPTVLTLKGKNITRVFNKGGQLISRTGPEQRSLFVRLIYFLFIGWWFSLIWMGIGYLLCISIIGLPFGIWMLNRLPEVTTIYRQE